MSSNQNDTVSHKMEDLQIKTLVAEPDTITELMNMLEVRRDLRRQYRYVQTINCSCTFETQPSCLRNSCFEVIHLFGPTIFALVVSHYQQRDAQLAAGAAEAIGTHMMVDGTPTTNMIYVGLKTQLELETILCMEYRCARSPSVGPARRLRFSPRNLYFTLINLIGAAIFNLVGDHHRQHDGVLEAEAARMDDMMERIRHAAD